MQACAWVLPGERAAGRGWSEDLSLKRRLQFRCSAQCPKGTYVDRGASHVLLSGGCSLSAFRAPPPAGGTTEGRPWCPPGRPTMGRPAKSRHLEPEHLTFPLPLPSPPLLSLPFFLLPSLHIPELNSVSVSDKESCVVLFTCRGHREGHWRQGSSVRDLQA